MQICLVFAGPVTFSDDTFAEGSHTVSSEPYFHDAAYKDPALEEVTIIDCKSSLATEGKSLIAVSTALKPFWCKYI